MSRIHCRTGAAIFTAVLLVSGCMPFSPTPGITAPVSAPPSHFTHKRPEPVSGPLSLELAIQIALDNNPGLRAGVYTAEAFKAREDIVRAGRIPNIEINGGFTNYLDSQRLVPAYEKPERQAHRQEGQGADGRYRLLPG